MNINMFIWKTKTDLKYKFDKYSFINNCKYLWITQITFVVLPGGNLIDIF